MKNRFLLFLAFLFANTLLFAQDIAVVKYSGGGDWYANPTALPNLIDFTNKNGNVLG